MTDRETLPASEHEAEAVALFEALIREFGESRVRLAQLAVLMGETDVG